MFFVQIGAMDGVVRDRIRMALNGHATVSIIIDENDDPLPDAWVETMGLAATGRAGVPLYLFYPGTKGAQAEVLPQLLTQDMLVRRTRA